MGGPATERNTHTMKLSTKINKHPAVLFLIFCAALALACAGGRWAFGQLLGSLRTPFFAAAALGCLVLSVAGLWLSGVREALPKGKQALKTGALALAVAAILTGLAVYAGPGGAFANGLRPLWWALVFLCLAANAWLCLSQRGARAARYGFCLPIALFLALSHWLSAYEYRSSVLFALLFFGCLCLALGLVQKRQVAALVPGRGAAVGFALLTLVGVYLYSYNKLFVSPTDFRFGPFGLPGVCFLLVCAAVVAAAGLSFLHGVGWVQQKLPATPAAVRPALWAPLFLLPAAGWSLWLLAFWPGNFSIDSVDMWGMALGVTPLHDYHPLFGTLWMKLFATLCPQPMFYLFCQIALLSTLYASILYWLAKKGVPRWGVLLLAVLFALLPSLGVYAATLWKDVPFLAALFWLAFLFARAVTGEKMRWPFAVETAIALTFVGLLRHNGFLIAIVCGAAMLLLAWRQKRWQPAAGAAGALVLCLVLNATAYRAMGITHTNIGLTNLTTNAVATVLYYDGEMPPDLLEEATREKTVAEWKESYEPFAAFALVRDDLTQIYEGKSTAEHLSIWLRLFAEEPFLLFQERMNMNDTNLFVDASVNEEAVTFSYCAFITENDLGIGPQESPLRPAFAAVLDAVNNSPFALAFLFRNGSMILLCLWLVYWNFRQKRPWRNLYFLPMVLNILTLFVALVEQSYRFTHLLVPFTLVGLLLSALPAAADENTGLYRKKEEKTPLHEE